MSLKTKFIYHVTTAAAHYIVIAHGGAHFEKIVPGIIEDAVKLGCVTKDVHDSTEVGVVTREWRTIE